MLECARAFLKWVSMSPKQWLNLDEQIGLLLARGLQVDDEASCRETLKRVGYYHWSGYARFFQLTSSPPLRTRFALPEKDRMLPFKRLQRWTLESKKSWLFGYLIGHNLVHQQLRRQEFLDQLAG